MNLLVVDSSVAYKWLSAYNEKDVNDALQLLYSHRDGTILLAAPDTLYVELASAVRCARHITESQSLNIIAALGDLGIEWVEASPARLEAATSLSYQHRISVYDALFLQLAHELDCPLVTADRRAFAHIDTSVEIRLI
ncbi:MAG: type II toxin-antitoxin system VapC family toxin [Coriobacteriia bacterium]